MYPQSIGLVDENVNLWLVSSVKVRSDSCYEHCGFEFFEFFCLKVYSDWEIDDAILVEFRLIL